MTLRHSLLGGRNFLEFFETFALLYLKVFSACANFLTVIPPWMQHMTKDILTTKITKATKCSDIFSHKLRALRVLRGQICFFFFGCGFAALGSMWWNSSFLNRKEPSAHRERVFTNVNH